MRIKKSFFVLELIILIASIFSNCFADTHIPSGSVSGIWDISGSPYIIEGDIDVIEDSALVIEPGVEVIFSGFYDFNVYGKIIAEGSINDTIEFTVNDTTNSHCSLEIVDGDITFQDSSKIDYLKISYGHMKCINSSKVKIDNSIIQNGIGLYISNSSPTILNSIFRDNNIDGHGGGIYCNNEASPYINNVLISGNIATNGGGAYVRNGSNPTFENVQFVNNLASISGGSLFSDGSFPIIINSQFYNNTLPINCRDNSYLIASYITINNNLAGIILSNSDLDFRNSTINNCTFSPIWGNFECSIYIDDVMISNNTSSGLSAGIHLDNSDAIILNSVISDNTSYGIGGGGLNLFSNSSAILSNVVLCNNSSYNGSLSAGIFVELWSQINISNSIIWNNSSEQIIIDNLSQYSINYNNIQGNFQGINNIDEDPLFIDDEYHLGNNSPCIDAGNPDSLYFDIEDPNNPGYALYPAMGTIINDMGAYGGHGMYESFVSINPNEIPNSSFQLSSYPNPFNPSTTISFSLTTEITSLCDATSWQAENTEISIYNLKGQKIRNFCHAEFIEAYGMPLSYSVIWNGTDNNNRPVSSGIYFARLKAGNIETSCKMLLLK